MRDPLFELLSTARSLVVVAEKDGLRSRDLLTFYIHPETHDEITVLAKELSWAQPVDFHPDHLWGIPLLEDDAVPQGKVVLRWEVRG
jgi:hypothetical protein